MLDIAILIIPKIDPYAPTVGPAVLKSHVEAAGYTCKVVDLNIDFYNSLTVDDRHKFYFTTADNAFLMEYDYTYNDESYLFYKKHKKWFTRTIQRIKKMNPKFVGMSLLTKYSRSFAYHLSIEIKKELPDIKIIWGGADAREHTRFMLDKKIIDYYVFGDGEFTLIDLLDGKTDALGVNSQIPRQVEDLSTVMIPNYDDINWDDYPNQFPDANTVYITGSRGCVKRCTFCDIERVWPKYKFRPSEDIFNEIVELRKKYKRKDFHFTDSLINGSMKSFRELLNLLKEYRKTDTDFGWRSQWIMRPQHQCTAEDFQLMKDSGCTGLDIGLESFSESVRFHMGKKIKDEDMWFCLKQIKEQEIQSSLLMIVGYPTETEEDHQISLKTIKKLYDEDYLFYTNAIGERRQLIQFGYGNTLMLDTQSPLYPMIKNDLVYYNNAFDWQYGNNTPAVRAARMKEIWEVINDVIGRDSYMEKIVASHMQGFNKNE